MIRSYPLLLKPAYKDYIWGGRRILDYFSRSDSIESCAESWEASDREEGLSTILNGPLKGLSLKELFSNHPYFFSNSALTRFPVLVKLIDAQDDLSIQVHPNDESASMYGGEAKTEMWYVIDAKEGSSIYLGLKHPLDSEELLRAIETQTLEKYMNKIPVKPGDVYYIPGGMIHSIGKGSLIYEVQQNSNTTYRLYDWGRVGTDGQSRPLHIQQALQTMLVNQHYQSLSSPAISYKNCGLTLKQLLVSPYFHFFEMAIEEETLIEPLDEMRIFFLLKGKMLLEYENTQEVLVPGRTILMPPHLKEVSFIPKDGSVKLLVTKTFIHAPQKT